MRAYITRKIDFCRQKSKAKSEKSLRKWHFLQNLTGEIFQIFRFRDTALIFQIFQVQTHYKFQISDFQTHLIFRFSNFETLLIFRFSNFETLLIFQFSGSDTLQISDFQVQTHHKFQIFSSDRSTHF